MGGEDEGEDETALLDPNESTVFRRKKKRWVSTALLLLTLVVVVVLLLVVGFVGGMLAGKAIYDHDGQESCANNSNNSNSSSQTPDWGGYVGQEGGMVSVSKWLDTELQPKNIRENLR